MPVMTPPWLLKLLRDLHSIKIIQKQHEITVQGDVSGGVREHSVAKQKLCMRLAHTEVALMISHD